MASLKDGVWERDSSADLPSRFALPWLTLQRLRKSLRQQAKDFLTSRLELKLEETVPDTLLVTYGTYELSHIVDAH